MRSTAMNTRWMIGVAGLVASVCSTAIAQSVAPVPPAPPAIGESVAKSTSTWTITNNDGGRSIKVSGSNGKITAEVDGKAVPQDRIVREGRNVQIKDDSGEVIFSDIVPGEANTVTIYGRGFSPRALNALGGLSAGRSGSVGGQSPFAAAMAPVADLPKVMIGVYLTEPDQSLRGHLGLKENETTLIAAVYEGLPASAAGVEPYDIIVSVDGKSPAGPEAVREILRDKKEGDAVTFEIIHQGQKKSVNVKVDKYDQKRIESAKRNAIAAMDAEEAIATIPGGANIWSGQGPRPFVARIGPGSAAGGPQTAIMWQGQDDDAMAQEMEKRIKELTEQAFENAGKAQNFGANHAELSERMNKLMEERMRKMEEMLQRLMEQRGVQPIAPVNPVPPPPAEKPTGSSSSKINPQLLGRT